MLNIHSPGKLKGKGLTYTTGAASADFVGEAVLPAWVTQEDGRPDHVDGAGRDGHGRARDAGVGVAASAEGIVHDLTALVVIPSSVRSAARSLGGQWRRRVFTTNLGVSDQDELGIGAALVEAVDGRGHSVGALPGRVAIGNTTAGRLATARRVRDGLSRGARVGALDLLDERACGTVAWAGGRLTGSEDVNRGTALGGCVESLRGGQAE